MDLFERIDLVAPNYPEIVTYAIPFFIGLIILELLVWRRRRNQGRDGMRYEARDSAASLTMGIGNVVTGALLGGLIYSATWVVYENRIMTLPFTWWVYVLCFFADDLCYYWFHRIAHERRWFWAGHVIHHSSQHYNLTTALRQTWTSVLAGGWIFALPMALVGFHPAMAALFGGISLVYQFWIHTEAINKFPRWFEAVMNTPSHHRVHHATNARYLDANYAGVLIIWDKMFGTFIPETDEEKPKYGIVRNLGTFNPLRIAFHEWVGIIRDVATAKSLKEVWGYTFGPPGWSPDGSRRTSRMLKDDWAAHQKKIAEPAE